MPCLYVFVSLVFVLTASATSQHNTPQQVGVRSTSSAVCVASQRVVPCLYVFVSLVFVLTASATSQHNTPQQVGVRIYKDSTTINSTCCQDLSVNAFFHVRATHPTQQVGSLPLAKNAKHSSSYIYYRKIVPVVRLGWLAPARQ